MLDELYGQKKDLIKSEIHSLREGSTIALTTDGWQSSDHVGSKYNSITAHCYSKGTIKSQILGFRVDKSSQTGDFILN